MQKKFTRTITLTYSFSDNPKEEGGNQYDDLDQTTAENIIRQEKRMLLSTWFAQTEYDLVDDEITEI